MHDLNLTTALYPWWMLHSGAARVSHEGCETYYLADPTARKRLRRCVAYIRSAPEAAPVCVCAEDGDSGADASERSALQLLYDLVGVPDPADVAHGASTTRAPAAASLDAAPAPTSDASAYCVVAPSDASLPNGSAADRISVQLSG